MTSNSLLSHTARLLFFLALQIILFRGLVLFNVAFCFIYLGAIITLPKEISHTYLVLVSFLAGVIVDAFYNTMGMHTAACTLIGYLRPYILLFVTPQRGYEDKSDFSIKTMGFIWFITFVGILVLIHHFFIFFLELGSFTLFFTTLLKVVCTFVFTMFMIVIFQFLRNN
jgi:hypothetical protein